MNNSITIRAVIPFLYALALPATSPFVRGQGPVADTPIVKGEIGAKLDSYMTRLSAFGMSGAILVAKGGEVILDKGYGVADRKSRAPVTRSAPFMIASLSKQFTAAAILKLEMQGKLSTSDTLGRFFPDAPKDKRGITLHQLLTHTAGLPYLSDDMFAPKSQEQALASMLKLPLASEPGSRFAYANPGYMILAGVIERASGKPFETYLAETLFAPAGMTHTGFAGDRDRWRSATIHSYSGTTDEGGLADFPITEDIVGAGSVVTTPEDLYQWELALRRNSILSAEATRKLFTPHVTTQGSGGYSYGWEVMKTIRGTTLIVHGGDLGGYNAEYRRYVDEDLVVIFTSNMRVNGAGYRQAVMNPISLLIAGSTIPEPPAVASVPESRLEKYAGSYRLPSGGVLRAWVENGAVMVGAEDQAGIAALNGGAPKDSASQAFLAMRTAAIVRGIASGDFDPLAGSLHPSLPLEDARKQIITEWAAYRDSLGALKEAEPIGTALLAPMVARSYYRLRFERGDVIGMYAWTAGKVTSIESGLTGADVTPFVPESGETLASFDIFTGRTIRISFTAAADGTISGLTLAGPSGEIAARRAG